MTPSLPCDDSSDIHMANAESSSEFSSTQSFACEIENINNLNFCKFRRRGSLPAQRASCCAPLARHIRHIVGLRPNKQMIWIAAGSHVALVTDVHSFRDFSAVKRPRNPVRWMGAIFHLKGPIPIRSYESFPQPTAVTIRSNLFHEPLQNGPCFDVTLLVLQPFATNPTLRFICIWSRPGWLSTSAFAIFHVWNIATLCRWGGRFSDGNHYEVASKPWRPV